MPNLHGGLAESPSMLKAYKTIGAFPEAGYCKAQSLEVILGISFKTLSNYMNHHANTPLDEAFESGAWPASIQSKPRSTTVRAA